MLIDSHCHLHLLNFNQDYPDIHAVMQQAKKQSLRHMLSVAVDLTCHQKLLQIAQTYPKEVSISVGVHPATLLKNEPEIGDIIKLGENPAVIAIGETGLDYYHEKDHKAQMKQKMRFRHHIQVARQLKKPLIIHMRDATDDTLAILREEGANQVGGVMHCFIESLEIAEAAIAMGFFISLSGIVTFKNAKRLQQVAKNLPLNRLLIETDAPYLAPHPYRGKPNFPFYVSHTADYLANLHAMEKASFTQIIGENYQRLFGLHLA